MSSNLFEMYITTQQEDIQIYIMCAYVLFELHLWLCVSCNILYRIHWNKEIVISGWSKFKIDKIEYNRIKESC